jgi:hypothetical protein
MKRFHSMLIAIIALVLFAPLAQAQPRPWDQVITNNRFRVLSDFNDAAGPGDRACLGAVARRRNPTNLV